MTITEQLQFSVLTAPVAALDRRTLSQAWYSALYGGSRQDNPGKHGASAFCVTAEKAREVAGAPPLPERASTPLPRHAAAVKCRHRAEGVSPERRAPRSPLARKIERALLRPGSGAHKTSFTLDGEHGRVHVVLQTRGSRLKLIAICPPKARAHVASALAQARYALALHGLDLDAEARGTPC
jgi:hypothetical protein